MMARMNDNKLRNSHQVPPLIPVAMAAKFQELLLYLSLYNSNLQLHLHLRTTFPFLRRFPQWHFPVLGDLKEMLGSLWDLGMTYQSARHQLQLCQHSLGVFSASFFMSATPFEVPQISLESFGSIYTDPHMTRMHILDLKIWQTFVLQSRQLQQMKC